MSSDDTAAVLDVSSIAVRLAVAAVYLAFAYLLLVPSETKPPFFASDFYFGSFWQRRFVVPFGFWLVTAVYAVTVSRLLSARRPLMRRAIRLLLGVHVCLALARFLAAREAEALTSRLFVLYSVGMAAVALLILCVWYLALIGNHRPAWTDPLVLPLALTPLLVAIAYGRAHPVLLMILGVAAAVRTVGHKRLAAATHALGGAARRTISNTPVILVLLFAISLAFRVTAAERLAGMGLQTVMTNSDDAQTYYRNGLKLLAGETVSLGYSIGYTAIVACYQWLTGGGITGMLVLQAVLCSTAPMAVYLLGRRIFDDVSAGLAAVLAAMSELLIFNSANLTREAVGSVLFGWLCVLLFSLLGAAPSRPIARLALLGLGTGALITIEPIFMPVFGLFFVILIIWHRGGALWKRVASGALTTAIAFAVIVCVRWIVAGEPGIQLRAMSQAVHVSKEYSIYSNELYARGINVFAFPGEFLANFAHAPGENGMLLIKKIALDFRRYFFESQSGAFDPVLLVRNSSLAAVLNTYGYVAAFLGFLLGLRRIGAVRSRWPATFAYFTTVTYSSAYIVLFFGHTRYRATISPLLLLFLAFGLVEGARWLRTEPRP